MSTTQGQSSATPEKSDSVNTDGLSQADTKLSKLDDNNADENPENTVSNNTGGAADRTENASLSAQQKVVAARSPDSCDSWRGFDQSPSSEIKRALVAEVGFSPPNRTASGKNLAEISQHGTSITKKTGFVVDVQTPPPEEIDSVGSPASNVAVVSVTREPGNSKSDADSDPVVASIVTQFSQLTSSGQVAALEQMIEQSDNKILQKVVHDGNHERNKETLWRKLGVLRSGLNKQRSIYMEETSEDENQSVGVLTGSNSC